MKNEGESVSTPVNAGPPRRGHLFIVHADITKLACDAWALTGSNRAGMLHVGNKWLMDGQNGASALPKQVRATPAPSVQIGDRVGRWKESPEDEPEPWLLDTGGTSEQRPEWYMEVVRTFLRESLKMIHSLKKLDGTPRGPLFQRALPLLAVPLVGTGRGGQDMVVGDLLKELLTTLDSFIQTNEADVALVVSGGMQYDAAQALRKSLYPASWSALDPGVIATAAALAEKARSGSLALLIGSGVSRAANLPDWAKLLNDLWGQAEDDRWAWLDPLDKATLIAQRLGGPDALRQKLKERLDGSTYALGHALLASLPVNEAITTNYDQRFEEASAVIHGKGLSVLPWGTLQRSGRWLLKMHGCVSHPEEIVLTREDYLRYEARSAALAGAVQGVLLTRHLLAVGFSMTDENFRRLMGEIDVVLGRAARGPGGEPDARKLGSVLVPEAGRYIRQIWPSFEWVHLGDGGDDHAKARRLDIFLDCLAAQASTGTRHLLDPRYDGALDAPERELGKRLSEFFQSVPPAERGTSAWKEVESLLQRLGARSSHGG